MRAAAAAFFCFSSFASFASCGGGEEDDVEEEGGEADADARAAVVDGVVVGAEAGEEDVVDAAEEAADVVEEEEAEEAEAGDDGFVVRFATYNVRTSNLNNGAWGDSHVGFDENDAARMRRVASSIAAQRLSVVALQEVRRPEWSAILDEVARLQGQQPGQRWSVTTQLAGADDTVVAFDKSVWRKVEETHFLVPLQPGLNDRSQIGVLLEHRESSERVWFYAVHLAAGPAGEDARRIGMRRTVSSIRSHAVARGQRFVLGGDFNDVAESEVGDILRAAGFAKNTRNVAERKAGNGCKTFNGRAGSAGQQSCPGGAARHIDQVWVSAAGMRVLRYQVTATALTSRASDHNPLTTILRVSAPS